MHLVNPLRGCPRRQCLPNRRTLPPPQPPRPRPRLDRPNTRPCNRNGANQKLFLNVDGDNNVVAADVIDVTNYIRGGRRLGGEAEATSEAAAADAFTGDQPPLADDVMALVAAELAAQATKKLK